MNLSPPAGMGKAQTVELSIESVRRGATTLSNVAKYFEYVPPANDTDWYGIIVDARVCQAWQRPSQSPRWCPHRG
jgi:hypothetical protein